LRQAAQLSAQSGKSVFGKWREGILYAYDYDAVQYPSLQKIGLKYPTTQVVDAAFLTAEKQNGLAGNFTNLTL
jgi:hypothetical protein